MKKIYLILTAYLIIGLILFRYYQYYAVTDIVPYLDIASKYLNGDWFNAVNGVWGALISWLLIPFLMLSIKPFVAFKLLNLIIGGVTIVGAWKLSKKFKISNLVETVLLVVLIPLILSFVLVHTTPDLLVVVILLFYLNIVFDRQYGDRVSHGLWLGLLGGVGYLAKHYVFYFVAIHSVLSHYFHYFYFQDQIKRKKILVNFVASFLVFAIISAAWIGVLSWKYGYFTVGTSMDYNRAWMAPGSRGHAPEYLGLVPPPNVTANSMWEDLTPYVKLMPNYNWSPLTSWDNFKYQVSLVGQNLKEFVLIVNKFSFLVGPIILLLAGLYLFTRQRVREFWLNPMFLSMVVIGLYSGGYLLIRLSDRYIWIVGILLLLMGSALASAYSEYFFKKNHKIAAVFLIGIFGLSFLATPVRRLIININQDKNLFDWSQTLSSDGVHGKIASNADWSNTSIISYYLKTKYYGMPDKDMSDSQIKNDLMRYGINYYLVWNDTLVPSFLNNVIPLIAKDNLKVYQLENTKL